MAPAASADASYSRSASPQLQRAIEAKFGSANDMKLKFANAALGLFGSGWTWLGVDPRGELIITTTPNQALPSPSASTTGQPCLVLLCCACRIAIVVKWDAACQGWAGAL